MHPLTLTFRFDQLPPEGRAFAGSLETAVVAEAVKGLVGDLGYRAGSPVAISGTAWPARHDVVVHGRFQAVLGFDCVRCLAPRELTVDQAVQHVLVHRAAEVVPGDDEVEVTDEDEGADEYAFDGEHVELAEVFREDLLLELPMNPTCAHAGLPECTVAVASGGAETVDPRWAPLAALREKLAGKGPPGDADS